MFLVTGARGQLGFDVVNELNKRKVINRGINSDDLDITDLAAVKLYLAKYEPECIIHCAGYTAVDKADSNEIEREKCFLINYKATKNIALICKELNIKLVYISTDYVFDGKKTGEYEVEDKVNPLSTYGKSKAYGEKAIIDSLNEYYIIRTSWLFGNNGNNFIKTILNLAKKKSEINVVCDQIGSPTYTVDLASAICDIVHSGKYGIYHVTNEGFCSWAQLAKEAVEITDQKCSINLVSTEEYGAVALRPKNSKLSKKRLIDSGFKRLPSWKDALKRYLENNIK